MAQIAQQDHLFVVDEVNEIAQLGAPQKAKLKACIVGGTIFDVVLKTKQAGNKFNFSRVIAYHVDETNKQNPTYSVTVVKSDDGTLVNFNL